MPVDRGSTNAARDRNIKAEIAAGKPVKQAVAIGYSEQRAARSKHMNKHSSKSHEKGQAGKHSAGMGTDGGADGSHEHTRHNRKQDVIETGHPDELERYHRGGANG